LEANLSTINTERLRDADTVDEMVRIKKELFGNREHLGRLITQVEHTVTHMPAYLNEYYEAFPTIRHRHKATYMSPVAHLPEILARASKLGKLILDDFQILMSSVSVQEGHDSTQQTRLATGIAVLAFIYVPLTLVTGIFGMNIDGTNGFAWWAPILALAGVVILTVGLLGIAFHSSTAWGQTINASGIVVKGTTLLSALMAPFGKPKTVLTDEEAAISKDKELFSSSLGCR
jgi:Mg2+ and Co2+ transporter CorA